MEGVWLVPLIKFYTKAIFGLVIELLYIFILHKSILIHFVNYGTRFYDKYITSDNRKKYLDNDRSDVFPKQKFRKLYNEKYQKNYSNQYYVLKHDHIKDTRIRRTYSGRKRRATGYGIF